MSLNKKRERRKLDCRALRIETRCCISSDIDARWVVGFVLAKERVRTQMHPLCRPLTWHGRAVNAAFVVVFVYPVLPIVLLCAVDETWLHEWQAYVLFSFVPWAAAVTAVLEMFSGCERLEIHYEFPTPPAPRTTTSRVPLEI